MLNIVILNDAEALGKQARREDYEKAFREMEEKGWETVMVGKSVKGGKPVRNGYPDGNLVLVIPPYIISLPWWTHC